jgi:GntR family transcriptional regulator
MARPASFQLRLDAHSGVPVYRQIIDQVLIAIASGALIPGSQLPTVRQAAVDLTINPNTVVRAYRELEIRGVLKTQQGIGTYVTDKPDGSGPDDLRERRLGQLAADSAARAAAEGFTLPELLRAFKELL